MPEKVSVNIDCDDKLYISHVNRTAQSGLEMDYARCMTGPANYFVENQAGSTTVVEASFYSTSESTLMEVKAIYS